MVRALFLLLLLTGVAAADECLVLIERDYREVAQASWMDAVLTANIAPDYLILVCDPEGLAALPEGEVLDCAESAVSSYLQVWVTSPAGRERATQLGRIIFERGDYLLIRRGGDPPAGFSLACIQAVTPLRPYRPAAVTTWQLHQRDRDRTDEPVVAPSDEPIVEHIVAAVDETSFQGEIQDLEDLETRNARTSMFALACSNVSAAFTALGLETELQTYTAQPWYGEEFTCWNVIGQKTGTEFPEEIFIVCGHLDSTAGQPWQVEPSAPGADDNASGSSVVLEAARVMAQFDFRHTVRFICFGAEEQGLCGSTYYAEQAAAAGELILGVLNIDMILYAPPAGEILRVYHDGPSTGLAQVLAAAAATYVPELDVEVEYNPGAAYSDHYPFWQQGYPAVQGCERRLSENPYYHTTDDRLVHYLDYFPFPTRCTQAAVATLATLAEPVGGAAVGSGTDVVRGGRLRFCLQPNPARGSTQLRFASPTSGTLQLSVHDVLGRALARPATHALLPPGDHAVELRLDGLAPGIYWVRAVSTEGVGVHPLAVAR